jgi:DNA (cytosine-5)-methyltransferase 1
MARDGAESGRSKTSTAGGVVGLFAGIGGIERGLHLAGFHSEMMCEIDAAAQRVLKHNFPGIPVVKDVRELRSLPKAEIVVAGFPCQDLSQAGKTAGIRGRHSGLVAEVFRLLSRPTTRPRWLLLENVPFMLHLQRGRGMRFLVESLEELGYAWAYRVVDARAFGLPQRRQRVLLLASRTEDPRTILFHGNECEPTPANPEKVACGFYWTEGLKGLGWAIDAVPTMKGGSTVGIPSPPAIRMPHDRMIVTPEIRDAERLQGFSADWTLPSTDGDNRRNGPRWRLVGNAVSVPVSKWVGERLRAPMPYDDRHDTPLPKDARWPRAAWGKRGKAFRTDLSMWPTQLEYQHLEEFLLYPTAPLSERATAGFLSRVRASTSLRFPKGFKRDIESHLRRMRRATTK